MKRCPECRRDYYDDTLSFCLEDGSPLVLGVSGESFDVGESATAILHTSVAPNATPFVPPEFSSDNMFRSASHRTAEAPLASVAVLPFAHLSRDPDDEYFCDGLAEELINTLAKLNDLKVVARSSAFSAASCLLLEAFMRLTPHATPRDSAPPRRRQRRFPASPQKRCGCWPRRTRSL